MSLIRVRIWDPALGRCIQALQGHTDSVWSVAFSHDGKLLASASADRTIRIWDPASGRCIQALQVGRILHKISFDATDQCLHTEIGAITLDALSASSSMPSIITHQSPRSQGYGLSSDGIWIMYNSEKVLWLPPEYRPSSSAATASTVAIGCSSGQVLIFNFTIHNSSAS